MCFNQPMSGFFAVVGFLLGLWAYSQTRNKALLAGIWYFVAMEALQFFQFFWLDAGCDDPINKALTVVGFIHICFQPLFTHILASAFMQSPEKKAQYKLVFRLCTLMGFYMFSRWVLHTPKHDLATGCPQTEWIRGDTLCTKMGTYHLAWSLPLTQPTYFMPSNNIHFFMMFAPFIALKQWIPGTVLFLTGPFLSKFITDNLHEQAAIWCFFSICQICLAVGAFRFGLVTKKKDLWHYKKGGEKKIADVAADSKTE